MRYALLVSYDGTDFSGWQIQKNARTVQETLQQSAQELFGAPVKITGSGRTDAGVHAEGQVCHFDAETDIPAEKLAACLNLRLPPDVRVLKSAACEGFDCTEGKEKTYRYTFYYAACELPLCSRYAVRVRFRPDCGKMRVAAARFVGEHDFGAFCASGSSAKTSVRTVLSAEISEREFPDRTEYTFTVRGKGFLYNMVRIMAGELYGIGCGKPSAIEEAFRTGKRELLGKTMPAKGLTLVGVSYSVSPFGEQEE